MGIFGLNTRYVYAIIPFTGFFIGKYLDDEETLRMINYRDKSALYGRDKKKAKEAAPPSWPIENTFSDFLSDVMMQ